MTYNGLTFIYKSNLIHMSQTHLKVLPFTTPTCCGTWHLKLAGIQQTTTVVFNECSIPKLNSSLGWLTYKHIITYYKALPIYYFDFSSRLKKNKTKKLQQMVKIMCSQYYCGICLLIQPYRVAFDSLWFSYLYYIVCSDLLHTLHRISHTGKF
jgi:hypothetical protein